MPTNYTLNSPDRPIYIELDSPHDYFTNGDPVRGCVRVHPSERPNGIKIEFSGYSRTKVTRGHGNDKRTFKARLEYFRTSLLLFNSESSGESFDIINRGIEEDGKVALPFEVAFPDSVMMVPTNMYNPSPLFEHKLGHPLPTSTYYDENRIEYILKVFVYKKVDWSPDETIALLLPFRPTPLRTSSSALVQTPASNEFCIRGHQLNPSNDQNPGALTKLKWATLWKYQHDIPEAWFKLEAKCPYILVTGRRIPITFSLENVSRTPEIPDAPVIFVHKVQVKITSVLTVRVPYSGFTGERDEMKDFPKDIVNREFDGKGKILWDGMRFEEFGALGLPDTTLTSFKTYGMRLIYRIRVIVDGNCGGETFSHTALRDVCEVVCDPQRPERDTNISASLQPAEPTLPTPEALPAYEPAPDYIEAISEDRGGADTTKELSTIHQT